MKTRRLVLALPIVLSVVAIASSRARADAGQAHDGGVADAGDGGDPNDENATGCGAMAPPNGASVIGAGCC